MLQIINIILKDGTLHMTVLVEGKKHNSFDMILDARTFALVDSTAVEEQTLYAAQARFAMREHYHGQSSLTSIWY